MNTNYGKLNEGAITYAPSEIRIGDTYYPAPTAGQYLTQGWKAINTAAPTDPAPTGYHYEPDGWEESDTAITRQWKTVADPVIYRAWTPLTILRGAKSGGFWAAIKSVLEANDALDEFMASQYCAECDSAFVAIRAIIVQQIGEEATAAFLDGLKVEKTGTSEELLEVA